ncbi:conserved hypothetical protein [Pediculus humanus corporis]|uniref:OCIA domain-containing protein n=1 Tax=Pediculus humanus subsp. corporis TaxID=121224 RepID=E0VV59_PEDHC|nr:uncharacterized protein Phum_PHUM458970 [Pediculus humanus corporis]EEB17265.1 conserved hypothetical protein [Pediculus humanus corporis]
MNTDREFRGGPQPYNTLDQRYPHQRQVRELTPEDIKEWNDCMRSGFYKVGVPFAAIMQYINYVRNKGSYSALNSSSILKKVTLFGINCFFGSVFYSPVCYSKLQQSVLAKEKKRQELGADGPFFSKGTTSTFEDATSSQSNLDPKFEGLDKTLSGEKNDTSKPLEMTYEELRRKNRENYFRNKVLPYTNYNSPQREKNLSESSTEKIPEKSYESNFVRKKNKYGDDME